MKYVVMLGDGMADRPVPELGGRTPLEAAVKPHMDFLAQHGTVGMARTVPEGMPPGSDTANLSVMGYDPKIYYSGRSPLEAVSMGIPLATDDVTFRCNLVNLSEEGALEDATMVDYSSDEITTAESTELVNFLNREFHTEARDLYPGISYRHCLVLRRAETGTDCTPPHDISLKPVREYLPKGRYGGQLLDLMKRSYALLRDHPVNRARAARGLRPANCCWFWGEGTRPALSSFEERFGVKGGVISAVDLIKGIGICAGLRSVDVPGATGNVDTNFQGKAEAAIELIDRESRGRLRPALQKRGEDYAVLLMPDHPTPLSIRTHSSDPVPFVLYRSDRESPLHASAYTEALAAKTGLFIPEGHRLMEKLLLDERI